MSVLDLFDLHGKRALITGASTGIGKRVALAYVEAGAQVAIAARHLDALEKLADEIEPPRHVRRLQFLERMGSCQVVHRGGTRRSCVSG
ncbi:SDR family NAD(P)-dependent oxidoreductase, partial [Mycobacterium tuberculosis]